MAREKRAALYVRVSTDQQSVENQVRELRRVAERRGWPVVEVYSDEGISGAKRRNQRPGLDRLLKDAGRRRFDVVMAWAIDRLGRSLIDLLGTIEQLEAVGVDLYLDQQAIDTTTPMGKLLFQVTGAFAEFERSMIRQRVRAGLAVVKEKLAREGRFTSKAGRIRRRLGRPGAAPDKIEAARVELAKGTGIGKTARLSGWARAPSTGSSARWPRPDRTGSCATEASKPPASRVWRSGILRLRRLLRPRVPSQPGDPPVGALPIKTDDIAPVSLPALVDRAAQFLAGARTAAEVLEARETASFAYDVAKRQARIARAKQAHDDVIAAVHRAQAGALEIEAAAKHRLADEYDAAQERGEVAGHGGDRGNQHTAGKVVASDLAKPPTLKDVKLSKQEIHEARQIRDAEKAEPGIVKRSIEERLEAGDEPTRAHLREVVIAAVMSGGREPRQSRKNPIYKPDPVFDALLQLTGSCRDIIAVREANEVDALLGRFIDDGMRSRDLRSIRLCRDLLTEILEAADAA